MNKWDKYKTVSSCPFCGGFELQIHKKEKVGWYVFCDICQIAGPIGRTENSAVNKWNTRPKIIKKAIRRKLPRGAVFIKKKPSEEKCSS